MITERPNNYITKVYCFVDRTGHELALAHWTAAVGHKFADIEAKYDDAPLELRSDPRCYCPRSIQEAEEVIELMQYYISQKEKEND